MDFDEGKSLRWVRIFFAFFLVHLWGRFEMLFTTFSSTFPSAVALSASCYSNSRSICDGNSVFAFVSKFIAFLYIYTTIFIFWSLKYVFHYRPLILGIGVYPSVSFSSEIIFFACSSLLLVLLANSEELFLSDWKMKLFIYVTIIPNYVVANNTIKKDSLM